MIHTIPNVTVAGFNYPVYSIDYNAGLNRGPSSFTVQFIAEDGNYTIPAIGSYITSIITIQGWRSFTVHPASYEISEDANGKIMTVTFLDTSVLLDKHNVGLKYTHGEKSIPWLTIVGTPNDPCGDEGLETLTDPCNPCQKNTSSARTNRVIECAEERLLKIPTVSYNFSELLSALPIAFKNIPKNINYNYRTQYTGTVREVLNQWCADYGYTFFWENNSVVFVDLRTGIFINDSGISNASNIISKSISEDASDSVSTSHIVNFALDGEKKPYDCNKDYGKKIKVFCIKLEDILNQSSTLFSYYGNMQRLEAMISMVRFSPELRDNYVWHFKEGITTATAAKAKIGGDPINLLGEFKIQQVFEKGVAADAAAYGELAGAIFRDPNALKVFEENNGYFVTATFNSTLRDKLSQFEETMANDFLGQYWLRKFNVKWSDAQINFSAPDGQVNYYSRHSDPAQFPFVDKLPISSDQAKRFLSDLKDIETNQNADNFILLKRSAYWLPSHNGSDEMEKFAKDMSDIALTRIGDVPIGLLSEKKAAVAKEGKELEVFLAYNKPGSFAISSWSTGIHPEESENVNVRTELLNYITHYGLHSAKTRKFSVKTKNSGGNITIWMPVQSSSQDTNAFNSGGYTVLSQHGSNTKYNLVIPKKLKQYQIMSTGGAFRYDIVVKDVTEAALNFLQSASPGKCTYNDAAIDLAMQNYIRGMKMFQSRFNLTKKYTLCGFPSVSKTLFHGLRDFSIRIGDTGVETTLVFNNLQSIPVADRVIDQRFEQLGRILHMQTRLIPSKYESRRPSSINSISTEQGVE